MLVSLIIYTFSYVYKKSKTIITNGSSSSS